MNIGRPRFEIENTVMAEESDPQYTSPVSRDKMCKMDVQIELLLDIRDLLQTLVDKIPGGET